MLRGEKMGYYYKDIDKWEQYLLEATEPAEIYPTKSGNYLLAISPELLEIDTEKYEVDECPSLWDYLREVAQQRGWKELFCTGDGIAFEIKNYKFFFECVAGYMSVYQLINYRNMCAENIRKFGLDDVELWMPELLKKAREVPIEKYELFGRAGNKELLFSPNLLVLQAGTESVGKIQMYLRKVAETYGFEEFDDGFGTYLAHMKKGEITLYFYYGIIWKVIAMRGITRVV